jgi:hypothetical protein
VQPVGLVSEVFKIDSDAPFLQQARVSGFDDERYQKYSQRLARLRGIRKYVYRMDVLERTLSYDEVTEIFVRVNSLGAKLRSSDLALAQITAKWRGSLETFQAYQTSCSKIGFELDLGIHLKNLVTHATGQSRFLTVAGLKLDQLRSGWDTGCQGLDFALNLLRSNTGISSPALLASPFLLISLGFYGAQRHYDLRPDEAAGLVRWVLLANAKGRYGRGSSETLLDQDLKSIRDGGSYQELLERLRTQVGRLDIAPEELAGRCSRLADPASHCPQPRWQRPSAAVSPHLPQGSSQKERLQHARDRRHRQSRLHWRPRQPPHLRQITG